MKLERVSIENYRAIDRLDLRFDPSLTVLHGNNAHGKTSVLSAIAVGLGHIFRFLPEVTSIGFLKTDRRGSLVPRVALWATNGVAWETTRTNPSSVNNNQSASFNDSQPTAITDRQALRHAMNAIVSADLEGTEPVTLPIFAFYDANRAVFDAPQRRRGFKTQFSRYASLKDALSVHTSFRLFFNWFYAKENEELREQKTRRDFDFRLNELSAVRKAIEGMVEGVSNPRIELRPLRFAVSVSSQEKARHELALDQLSGGVRIMLALAADLAWRMAQGNPHLACPLESEAIVLIDEMELHLHPAWQQRVLTDLTRTFPNAQFIVSTHSPQVLTTVHPLNIIRLVREDGRILAYKGAGATYGAEAGDVLSLEMGVDERPPKNDFTRALDKYRHLVSEGQGESEEALALRRDLENLSPFDPALNRAELEIRRRKLFKQMGQSQ